MRSAVQAVIVGVAVALAPVRGAAGEPAPPPSEARAQAGAAPCGAAYLLWTAVVAEAAMAGWSALAASHPRETGIASMAVSPFGCANGVPDTDATPYLCGAMFAGLFGAGLWAATDYSSGDLSRQDRFWRGMIAWNAVAAATTTAYLLRDRGDRAPRRPAGARPRVGVAALRGGAAVLLAGEL